MQQSNGLTRKTAPPGYIVRVYDSERKGTLRRQNQRRRIHVVNVAGEESVLSGRQLRMLRKRAKALAKQGIYTPSKEQA